jgi:hypothetical protein
MVLDVGYLFGLILGSLLNLEKEKKRKGVSPYIMFHLSKEETPRCTSTPKQRQHKKSLS